MVRFLLIIFLIVFVVPFVLRTLMRFLFGSQAPRGNSSQQKQRQSAPQQHKKVFPKDEGEYIDYEEVKD
ncbi:MAG: DUF4834 family protein [Tannerella sp.]|nr:DUF4834 family protein [Tannerella sp.]